MKKKHGGKLEKSLGRISYENKKVNKLLLQLKSTVDDMNGLLNEMYRKK